MHLRQLLLLSVRETLRARARSLAMLAVGVIGTASLTIALTYAEYARGRALDQISRLGVRLIAVTPAPQRQIGVAKRAISRPLILTASDVRLLQRQVPSVTRASPVVVRSARLKAGDLSRSVTVVGCEQRLFDMRRWPLVAGDHWSEADHRSASRLAVVGAAVAREFFGDEQPLGATIRLDGVRFVVCGVLEARGEGADGINEDQQVWIPLTTAMRRLFHLDSYTGVVLEADSQDDVEQTATASRVLLEQRNHVSATAIRIEVQKLTADTLRSASGRLTSWLELVAAAGSILAGGGTLMIVWSAIADRTRELGTLRAIGASRWQIAGQLMSEALSTVIASTIVGIATAALIWFVGARRGQLPVGLSIQAVFVACAAGITAQMIGAAFGTRRATRLDVIDSLRAE